jgi:hypothetical protein
LKKVENQTAGERASGQNPQIKKPNRQKTVGQHCKTRLENRTTQAPIFGDITKKKGCDNIFVTAFWCDREDSNLWPSGSENYDKPVQTNVEA